VSNSLETTGKKELISIGNKCHDSYRHKVKNKNVAIEIKHTTKQRLQIGKRDVFVLGDVGYEMSLFKQHFKRYSFPFKQCNNYCFDKQPIQLD
jgi:hypothetical protein